MPAVPSGTQSTLPTDRGRSLSGLLVDWGGVLTSSLENAMGSWAETDGIDLGQFRDAMARWLGTDYADEAGSNPIHALERGELEVPHFEEQLAARLTTIDGQPVEAPGLVSRMLAGLEHAPDMVGVVRRARAAGLRTGLLSNSWGNGYSREGWSELFDAVVISGEVGMRKPEARIDLLAAERLGLAPEQVVFVDDLRPNVVGAAEVGMVAIHHVTVEETVAELEALFDLPLR
jgi:epoxide hydrolase-like predicted phosphatase